jgi:hypothetical protein
MGMDLGGKGGYFRFNNATWREVLKLAYDYGWKPAGTEPGRWIDEMGELDKQMCPDPETWESMDYFSNGYQWVTDEDAGNIAEALERALEDIPDEDTVGVLAASLSFDPVGGEVSGIDTEQEKNLTPLDWFSGEYKQMVREFIDYCRAGEFFIS